MRGSRAADPAAGRLGIFATSPRRTAHGPEARARARSGRLATRRVRRTASRFRYAILGVRGALLIILLGCRRAALRNSTFGFCGLSPGSGEPHTNTGRLRAS